MNIIPAAPTENLYKFFAIFGLWLFVILGGVLIGLQYLSYLGDEELKATQSFYSSKDTDRKVMARIKAIQEGRLNDDRIELSADFKVPSEELRFLQIVHENHQKAMATAEPAMNQHIGAKFHMLERLGIKWLLPTYSAICFLFVIYGFSAWHKHIQRPADRLIPIEFKIKEVDLQLKEMELAQRTVELQLKNLELRRMTREEEDSVTVPNTPASSIEASPVLIITLAAIAAIAAIVP